MKWYETLIIFILVWGFLERQKEIAAWPNWKSKFGPWIDTVNLIGPKWWFFRDAYHTFKGLSICVLCIIIVYYAGFANGVYAYAAWAVGQYIGKLTKKE